MARFMLVWFVLSVGVAMASPLVAPKAMDLVCTTGGAMKIVSPEDADDNSSSAHTMDCALCMSVGMPTASISSQFTKPSPLAHALHPIAAAHIAAATAPPLPSRGPPAL
jgi:succinate dehydrogenase/fumarate reductase-like Fe-S protein